MTINNVGDAIRQLKQVGAYRMEKDFPAVNSSNIANDLIYSSFFKQSLKETLKDLQGIHFNKDTQRTINYYKVAAALLIKMIEKNLKMHKLQ